jgi:hypothetical protein
MDANKHDDIDAMIDCALSCYGDATPLTGLEQRVLNRIRLAESDRQGSRWLRFALAFAMVLVLVAVGVRVRPRNVSVPVKTARTVAAAPVESLIVPQRRARRSHSIRPIPKERRFPSFAPLSREERTLLAYVRLRQPGEDPKRREDKPIEIDPIQIPPLQSDGNQ